MKKWFAVVCCVAMLVSLMGVGASADNGLEIWSNTEVMHVPFGGAFYPYYAEIPEDYMEEDLLVSFSNEGVIAVVGEEFAEYYLAVAPGKTEMTVQTSDGAYADTITVVVDPAIEMTADRVTVYTNAAYQSRCFSYVPAQDGAYEFSLSAENGDFASIEVLNDALETVAYFIDGGTVELTGGETYYIYPLADGNGAGDVYDLKVMYLGEILPQEDPSPIVFAQDTVTISLYDTASVPAYTFEPGGVDVYDSVVFTVDDDSVLMIDPDYETMMPLATGTVTLTATAENYGWSDTVEVTVVDEKRVLTAEEPLDMNVEAGGMMSAFFTAPEAGAYTFYSVTEGDGDPICYAYDAQSGEELGSSDDVNGYDFALPLELEEGQSVQLCVTTYYSVSATVTLAVGTTVEASGVEIRPYGELARKGDTVYVQSGDVFEPMVAFLGGPTAIAEEYEFTAYSEDVVADDFGWYNLKAGQSVTYTVVTENGLIDTVTITAIDLRLGDLDLDGEIGASDAMTAFYALNGLIEADAATLGSMEVTGDNRITLADAARIFYAANGLVEIA